MIEIISATHVTHIFVTNVTYVTYDMCLLIIILKNRRIKKKFTKIKVIGSYW